MGNGIANDNYVTTANINTVTNLNVNSLNIADLTGIEDFIALTELICHINQLTNLNVSQNTALIGLSCSLNQLSSLDVSQNTSLTQLGCFSNQLINLDLSQNTLLTSLLCSNNQLTSLNVKNGNNINMSNSTFYAMYNPNLTCIEVDDAAWSATNWMSIDSWANFSSNCANTETYTPDDNFENYLETHDANGTVVSVGDSSSMGNGIANDNYVTTANINTVTNLEVSYLSIADLTGIEDFIALSVLNCHHNALTTLNITQNTSLTELACDINQITNLDVTQNIGLTKLHCYNNQLTSLNVNQNVALTDFRCYNNYLTNLDVTLNTSLVTFECGNNQLTSLNVKNGNNTNIVGFNTINNPNLTCIEVDDAAWSATNWMNIDATSTFVNNQVECDALSTDDEVLQNVFIYPNPVKSKLYVQAEAEVDYKLFSITGKLVLKGKINQIHQFIDVSKIRKGMYFIKLEIDNKNLTKKIIIN